MTEKARFPNWVRVLMTTAALVVEERRRRRPDSSLVNLMILLRHACWPTLIKSSVHQSFRPGRPRINWLEHIRQDSGISPAHLWHRAVKCRHTATSATSCCRPRSQAREHDATVNRTYGPLFSCSSFQAASTEHH